jgi:hypothetical protein
VIQNLYVFKDFHAHGVLDALVIAAASLFGGLIPKSLFPAVKVRTNHTQNARLTHYGCQESPILFHLGQRDILKHNGQDGNCWTITNTAFSTSNHAL